MERNYLRVVCVDEGNPLEYEVLEDTNKGNLNELHKFLIENWHKYCRNGVKWILIPATVEIK